MAIAQIEAAEEAEDDEKEERLRAEKKALRALMRDDFKGMRDEEAALVESTKKHFAALRSIVVKRREKEALESLSSQSSRSM